MTERSASPPPRELDSPRAIWLDSWARLTEGAAVARHAFHLGTLATVGKTAPELRTVVLRDVDASKHLLTCHTDRRSPKAHAIQANENVSWLFYDPQAKLQLRLCCRAQLLCEGDYWASRWDASRISSRLCYVHTSGPGTTLAAALDYGPASLSAQGEASVDVSLGRDNFAVIASTVTRLDWLCLHHAGHRRMRFHVTPMGFDAAWIAP